MELRERLQVDPSFHDNLYLLRISFIYFLHSTTEVFGHLGNASQTEIYIHICMCVYTHTYLYTCILNICNPIVTLGLVGSKSHNMQEVPK